MSKHAIGEILHLRRLDAAHLTWSSGSTALPTIAKRWEGVPTSGGAALILTDLEGAMRDPEKVRAVFSKLPADDRKLVAAYARFGGFPTTLVQAAAPFVGAAFVSDPATRTGRDRILGKVGEAAQMAGLLWRSSASGHWSAEYRYVPIPDAAAAFPWTWTPLALECAEAPEREAGATPPPAYFAAVLAAVSALRNVPKPTRKDGMLSAAAEAAAKRVLEPLREGLDGALPELADPHWLHSALQVAGSIAFVRDSNGKLADWSAVLDDLLGTRPNALSELVSLWRRSLWWAAVRQIELRHGFYRSDILPDPLLLHEALLRIALADNDWHDVSALRNHLSHIAYTLGSTSHALSPRDEAGHLDWLPAAADDGPAGGYRPPPPFARARDLALANRLFALRGEGWVDLGIRGDRLLFRPSAWARWIAGHGAPVQRMASLVDGSGSLLVDPAGVSLGDVSLLGTVGKLVRATNSLLTYRITTDSVAQGLALGVPADTVNAQLERIAGRPLDAVASGGVSDATKSANRYERLENVDVTIHPDGRFTLSRPTHTRHVPGVAVVDDYGITKVPASDDAVALTRVFRLTEQRGTQRAITATSLERARKAGLPLSTIDTWANEHLRFVLPGHWASLRSATRTPPAEGYLIRCQPPVMYDVMISCGAKGVVQLGNDSFFVPTSEYPQLAAELDKRGLMLRG